MRGKHLRTSSSRSTGSSLLRIRVRGSTWIEKAVKRASLSVARRLEEGPKPLLPDAFWRRSSDGSDGKREI